MTDPVLRQTRPGALERVLHQIVRRSLITNQGPGVTPQAGKFCTYCVAIHVDILSCQRGESPIKAGKPANDLSAEAVDSFW